MLRHQIIASYFYQQESYTERWFSEFKDNSTKGKEYYVSLDRKEHLSYYVKVKAQITRLEGFSFEMKKQVPSCIFSEWEVLYFKFTRLERIN
jgi:hypothetical protein